jgi:predicted nucleic acid-binding protein
MKKLKIYLDQQDTPERMAETHILWDKIKADIFEVVISDVTIAEINDCDKKKRETLFDYLNQIKYIMIESDRRSVDIASRFVDLGILNQKSFDDCQHIANAIVSGCDIIVSWNFKHIVNHKTMMGVKAVTALEGYDDLLIYDPSILTGGEEK